MIYGTPSYFANNGEDLIKVSTDRGDIVISIEEIIELMEMVCSKEINNSFDEEYDYILKEEAITIIENQFKPEITEEMSPAEIESDIEDMLDEIKESIEINNEY